MVFARGRHRPAHALRAGQDRLRQRQNLLRDPFLNRKKGTFLWYCNTCRFITYCQHKCGYASRQYSRSGTGCANVDTVCRDLPPQGSPGFWSDLWEEPSGTSPPSWSDQWSEPSPTAPAKAYAFKSGTPPPKPSTLALLCRSHPTSPAPTPTSPIESVSRLTTRRPAAEPAVEGDEALVGDVIVV